MQVAFTGADVVIMLGAFPRKDGMERKDLLEKNCGIFKEQVRPCPERVREGRRERKDRALRTNPKP